MGFFKDFKDDFSQAVNELMPADDNLETSTNEDDGKECKCPDRKSSSTCACICT